MTNWTKYYEEYEEELHSETTRKSVKQTKKKKTWKQMNEQKKDKPRKQWQKKKQEVLELKIWIVTGCGELSERVVHCMKHRPTDQAISRFEGFIVKVYHT